MKKLYLIKRPEVFQGERYLEKDRDYFEGWYFKNTNDMGGISFIPGININKDERKAFIQVITDDSSFYVDYEIEDFKFSYDPFYVMIGNNYFSRDGIHIDIRDDKNNLRVYGDVRYCNSRNIEVSSLKPNIMGLFSYVPFMECNHAILSMRHRVDGSICINDREIVFDDDIGYIEKDWGCSFPKSYIWCQGNNFDNDKVAFMLSIADIPFKVFSFRGFICSLLIGDKEYRFATYNGAMIVRYEVVDGLVNIVLKKGLYYLELDTSCDGGLKLNAPVKGKMEKNIRESISAVIRVTLRKGEDVIFDGTSVNCGLEIVCD